MNREDREVRELLRAHDPAREDGDIPVMDRARMRQAVLQEVVDRSLRPGRLGAMAGAGLGLALLAVVAAFLLVARPDPVPTSPAPRESGTAGVLGEPAGPAPARQIQMTTPGGTRIVWILKS